MGGLFSARTEDRPSAAPSKQNAESDHRIMMPNYIGATDAAEWLQASCDGEVYTQVPTVGFNVRTSRTQAHRAPAAGAQVATCGSAVELVISSHRIGGCDNIAALFRAYPKLGSTLIVYAVVAPSVAALSIQRGELDRYFFQNGPEFDGCPAVFLINTEREQPPGFLCMETNDLVAGMRLHELR